MALLIDICEMDVGLAVLKNADTRRVHRQAKRNSQNDWQRNLRFCVRARCAGRLWCDWFTGILDFDD